MPIAPEPSAILGLGPRLIVAGTHSGVGKTTVATGLMAALTRRGLRVGAAKVGPDFIDPGYHALATGRPGRNLDAWMCGTSTVAPLAARAAAGCDLLVIEGVMGLFDGAAEPGVSDAVTSAGDDGASEPSQSDALTPAGDDGPGPGRFASTAHVARLLDAPILLVVDASSMSASVAAVVHGFCTLEPGIGVGGVILNRVASDSHEAMLRAALAPIGVAVLGVLRRTDEFAWRDRHLGLIPVVERQPEIMRSLDALATSVGAGCDLDAIVALARSARTRQIPDLPRPAAVTRSRVRVAVAAGPAFSFAYADNLEAMVDAGAEIVPFDPMIEASLPESVQALYVGGGFPEVFADHLAANRPLLNEVRRRVVDGLVTWAECGGLLWLAQSLDDHAMAGALAAEASMTPQLHLGYRRATVRIANPVAPIGAVLRGHEFHYSMVQPAGEALDLAGRSGTRRGGWASPTLLASYLHLHLAGQAAEAGVASRFLAAAAAAPTTVC